MSIQKYLDQKRGGDTPPGDIKSNAALIAAALAGRQALKRVNTVIQAGEDDQKQMLQKVQKKMRMICGCGDAGCDIGPFTLQISS